MSQNFLNKFLEGGIMNTVFEQLAGSMKEQQKQDDSHHSRASRALPSPSVKSIKQRQSESGQSRQVNSSAPKRLTQKVPPITKEYLSVNEVLDLDSIQLDQTTDKIIYHFRFYDKKRGSSIGLKCSQKDCEVIYQVTGKDYLFNFLKKCLLSMGGADVETGMKKMSSRKGGREGDGAIQILSDDQEGQKSFE